MRFILGVEVNTLNGFPVNFLFTFRQKEMPLKVLPDHGFVQRMKTR